MIKNHFYNLTCWFGAQEMFLLIIIFIRHFCNIVFVQFNASVINKMLISFLKKKDFWKVLYIDYRNFHDLLKMS